MITWIWYVVQFYHRRLPPETPVVGTTPAAPLVLPPCSKCDRHSVSLAELHRHMLDCGGDTSWQATMLAMASPGTRRRKWRPFGSRRRRQQGRRLLKRNIPNTPAKHSTGRIRTKPGDSEYNGIVSLLWPVIGLLTLTHRQYQSVHIALESVICIQLSNQ